MDKKQILITFGMNVRKFRERKGYSLLDLSAESGISKRQLLYIEHGKSNTTIVNMVKLCDALDVKPGDLLG